MDIVRVAPLVLAIPLAGCAYGSIESTEPTSSAVTADGRRHLRAKVTGLLGGGLVVRGLAGVAMLSNGDDVLSVHGTGRFTMPDPVTSGASFNLAVADQPAGETCTIIGGEGKMGAASADVVVDCASNTDSIATVQ